MLTNHPVLLLPVAEGTSRTNTKVSVHAGDAAAQEGRQLVCSSKGCSFSPWLHAAVCSGRIPNSEWFQTPGWMFDRKMCSDESVCLKCSSRKAKIYKLIYKLKESTAAMSQLKRLDGWSLGDFVSSEEELVLGWFPPARHGCRSGRPKSFLWPPAGAAVSQSLYHHHRSPEQWVTL